MCKLAEGSKESVESLTYDPVDNLLMWTDGYNQSIRRVRITSDGPVRVAESASVEVVHFLNGDKPRGLVSDPCTRLLQQYKILHSFQIFIVLRSSNRMMYWTNWNTERPTIERSHINGSDRQVIIGKDLFMPHGLGLDIAEQRIYWANNMRHGSFQIERSFVDGSERQLVYHGEAHRGRGQFIYGLTVSSTDNIL